MIIVYSAFTKTMKLKFLLILLTFSLYNTYAQNDTIYYNTKWKVATKDVNGGTNGLADRKKYTKKAYEVLNK